MATAADKLIPVGEYRLKQKNLGMNLVGSFLVSWIFLSIHLFSMDIIWNKRRLFASSSLKKEGIFCFRACALVRSRESSAVVSMRAPEALHNQGIWLFNYIMVRCLTTDKELKNNKQTSWWIFLLFPNQNIFTMVSSKSAAAFNQIHQSLLKTVSNKNCLS